MKRLIILLLLLTTYISKAQITEIKNKSEELSNLTQVNFFIASLHKTVDEDNYFMAYSDEKNQKEITKKEFTIGNKKTVLQFRDILLNMIKNKTKLKQIEFEGKKFILKSFAGRRITIDIINEVGIESSMRYLNRRTIEKLFPRDRLN